MPARNARPVALAALALAASWASSGPAIAAVLDDSSGLEVTTATISGNAFSVGGSTLVVTGGRVGILTNNPSEPLHVAGDAIYGQMQTFSGATSVTFSGLNGNNAKYYEISGRFRIDGISANQSIYLRPNNDSGSNYHGASFRMYWGETTPGTITTDTLAWSTPGFVIGVADWGTTGTFIVRGLLYAQTGSYRQYSGEHVFIADTSDNTLKASQLGHWHDSTNNITSIVILPTGGTISGELTLRAFR